MSQSVPEIVKRLANLDSNLVSDVMDAGGLRGQVLAARIRPLDPGFRLLGIALCARGVPVTVDRGPKTALGPFDIDAAMFPGGVVVLENGGPADSAVLGGLMAKSWQALGGRGMVTDGLVRDSRELIEMGFPVFSTGATPAASGGRWALLEVGGEARLEARDGNDLVVRDGDLIVGDIDGCSVVPGAHAEAIVAAAETLKAIEGRIVAMMDSGKGRREAFAANPRFDHVPRFADSDD
jgi:4-hydroxy-4-methyl-2-oxoglutarate aldolase